MKSFDLTFQSINRDQLIEELSDATCGACITFEGWVRNHHQNRQVSHLFYEAYQELAIDEGQLVVNQATEKFEIQSARAVHRLGHLQIGDMAVWVGVNAAHRDAAFQACRFIIDEVKLRVPIWKKEFYTDTHPARWLASEKNV